MISTVYTTSGRHITDTYKKEKETITVTTSGTLDQPIFKSNTYDYAWKQSQELRNGKPLWKSVPLYYYSNTTKYSKHDIRYYLKDKSQFVNVTKLNKEVRNKLLTTDIAEEYEVCIRKDHPQIDYDDPDNVIWVCFGVASYVASLFGLDRTYEYDDFNIDKPEDFLEFMRNAEGVYLIYVNNNLEGHGFVAYMKESFITIYNGYGGYEGVIVHDTNRTTWISAFNKSSKSRKAYADLWGFDIDLVVSAIGNEDDIVFEGSIIAKIF